MNVDARSKICEVMPLACASFLWEAGNVEGLPRSWDDDLLMRALPRLEAVPDPSLPFVSSPDGSVRIYVSVRGGVVPDVELRYRVGGTVQGSRTFAANASLADITVALSRELGDGARGEVLVPRSCPREWESTKCAWELASMRGLVIDLEWRSDVVTKLLVWESEGCVPTKTLTLPKRNYSFRTDGASILREALPHCSAARLVPFFSSSPSHIHVLCGAGLSMVFPVVSRPCDLRACVLDFSAHSSMNGVSVALGRMGFGEHSGVIFRGKRLGRFDRVPTGILAGDVLLPICLREA